MSRIVRAKVLTNSSEDLFARVSVSCEGLWESTPLIDSVDMIPLKKGDIVFVDASDLANPLILGRAGSKENKPSKKVEGSLLFDSSDGSDWTVAFVKDDKFEISNSAGTSVVIEGSKVKISNCTVELAGTVGTPGTIGGFCAISVCPYNGQPHVSPTIKV